MNHALKVHLRVLDIHRTTLRVVTLRPQTGVRFSSNYFHDTWHILGDGGAAAILGRLLWGLAFQTHPGTLVLIDRDHLVPTPFEADPPDPIVLVPDGLTAVSPDVLGALKLRLRRGLPRPSTIRWHTFGMPAALAADTDRRNVHREYRRRGLYHRERMSRRAGFVCYTAPRDILRTNALGIFQMTTGGRGYFPLADWRLAGEFQVIDDFARNVSAAVVARREILGRARPIASEEERRAIYDRKEVVLARGT